MGKPPTIEEKITRPGLPYMGSKFKIRKWVQQFFPEHDIYLSPYGGGANDFLDKPIAHEEYYNDLNPRTFRYFVTLTDMPERLIQVINETKPSREELDRCWEQHQNWNEDARRYYVYSLLSFSGGGSRWNSGCATHALSLIHI